ncbi:hypothetical protein [Halobaculum sp. MBLA0143]|uniref:hypothetical protein n=1 Tax=Halobaculum sp. MBLA0143 TaxID=3079933 RepID=UPI003523CE66
MSLNSDAREYVDTFEADEVGHVEVFSEGDSYVGVPVDGDEQYSLRLKRGQRDVFVTQLDGGREITLRPVDDGFFRSAQPVPRFVRRLAGLESRSDRD